MTQINFFPTCRMNPNTGYGQVELGLMRGMLDAGLAVSLCDRYTRPRVADAPTIVTGSPEWGEYMPGRLWALTMSESTKCSDVWVESFNRLFERVFVPAPFLVEVYKDSGIEIPVHVVPLGVDYQPPEYINHYPAFPPGWNNIEYPSVAFNWLTYSLGDTRKGSELAMMAFNRLFAGDERHHLYIKCRDNPLWLTGLEDPQMTIVRGEITQKEWYDLLGMCHAFIFPSRGEGFGYPPRQAVLSGLPTIAVEAHGTWDVRQWGYPLPVAEMRPAQFSTVDANGESGMWWEPDKTCIDAQMSAIIEDYPAALEKAREGRDYLLQHFTWAKTVQAMTEWL